MPVQGGLVTGRRLALMLLLYSKGPSGRLNEPIEGRTRLTKMLFLLDKENDVFRRVAKLEFEPYAFGPYDPKVYDDLGFLDNMGWLRGGSMSESGSTAGASFHELVGEKGEAENALAYLERPELNEADLSFDYLMSGVSEELPERYETRKYALSEKGLEAVNKAIKVIENQEMARITSEIEQVKKRYNSMPLRDLLRHVYRKYPESASDSTILEELRLR